LTLPQQNSCLFIQQILFRTSHSPFDQLKLNPFFSACLNRQNSSPPASSAITCHIEKVAKVLQAPSVHHHQKKETFQNFRISPSRSDFYTE
ncbi:hypothetical protein ACMA7C_003566, partial [Shigella flexneri]